jgi:hypothetical protein
MSSKQDEYAAKQLKLDGAREEALRKADQRLATKRRQIRMASEKDFIRVDKKTAKGREAREREIEVERQREEAGGEKKKKEPRSCLEKILSALCCRGEAD